MISTQPTRRVVSKALAAFRREWDDTVITPRVFTAEVAAQLAKQTSQAKQDPDRQVTGEGAARSGDELNRQSFEDFAAQDQLKKAKR